MKINLNWLKVDNATRSLRSFVQIAINEEIRITHEERRAKGSITETERTAHICSNRKIPAVTKVEEWTNEETGVGAAIAMGSHELKGNCADFVIAVLSTIRPSVASFRVDDTRGYFEKEEIKIYLTISTKKASPIRLENTVIFLDKEADDDIK